MEINTRLQEDRMIALHATSNPLEIIISQRLRKIRDMFGNPVVFA
jgi:hypothetical protein